ncbi:hypothetical protein [Amycolatopsis aidingensis]|uniref:hypothetical protein n=1 Tax=Amycolatopsis aidingensis TaxID=2842453 RepID=UPI001C0B8494|nr:hypothetical protein [Amycolatopsis aidingensis]
MSRIVRPVQYGSSDLTELTRHEVDQARRAGHLRDLMSGNDPDAHPDYIHHTAGCSRPAPKRISRNANARVLGEPIIYRCPSCGGTNKED